jgi:hypothetical protein
LNTTTTTKQNQRLHDTDNKNIFISELKKPCKFADKKNLFVLTDEIIEDDINQDKLHLLLSQMLDDNSMIEDKTFTNNTADKLISQIYLAMSPDSKRLLTETDRTKKMELQSFFHHLIGYNYDKYRNNSHVSNDILTAINSNIIEIEDCMMLITNN